jgi:hypothetical protein
MMPGDLSRGVIMDIVVWLRAWASGSIRRHSARTTLMVLVFLVRSDDCANGTRDDGVRHQCF